MGLLPAVNLNKKLENDIKLNFKLESRQELQRGFLNESNNFKYEYILTDFTTIGSKKIAHNKSLALGYLFRIRDGKIVQRSIQQFIITKKYTGFKLAHRIATDQTFQASKKAAYRFRYRLSSEISLNGQAVDVKEFYIKMSNEYLNFFQQSDYDLEIRLASFLGYRISNQQKIEFGLDYRVNSFIESHTSNRFWIGLNWYVSL